MSRLFALALAAMLLAQPVHAHEYKVGDLEIERPWARPSAAKNGAAYMSIVAKGKSDDRLTSAASPVAEKVELHTRVMEGDIMRMRPVDAIDVKPGQPAELKPGGLHVMLIGLKQPLQDGKSFPLTLTFQKAGTVTVEVSVSKQGAAPTHGGHHPAAPKPAQ